MDLRAAALRKRDWQQRWGLTLGSRRWLVYNLRSLGSHNSPYHSAEVRLEVGWESRLRVQWGHKTVESNLAVGRRVATLGLSTYMESTSRTQRTSESGCSNFPVILFHGNGRYRLMQHSCAYSSSILKPPSLGRLKGFTATTAAETIRSFAIGLKLRHSKSGHVYLSLIASGCSALCSSYQQESS